MELHLILLFMIFASILAVEIKDLISSLIALTATGLSLCLAFLLLKAPNLAMTQLVVEILCIIILIRSTINKDLPLIMDGRWVFNTAASLAFVMTFLGVSYFALRELPVFGEPIMKVSKEYLEQGLRLTGSANIVSGITLNFRSFDAVAEAAVLFTAVLGVFAITRKTGRANGKE